MSVDFIIVGQGIAGTLLSYTLMQKGCSVLVIDEYKANSASRVAAGVVNPVSGRRFTTAWEYETFYPILVNTYQELEKLLGIPVFVERDIWMALPSAQLRSAFMERTAGLSWFREPETREEERYNQWLDQPYGAAVVKGGTVLLTELLPAWRKYLTAHNALLDQKLDYNEIQLTATGVQYKHVEARQLIFCEGAATTQNPWFSYIPFLLNKGEVLHIQVDGLQTEDILKRSISIVPQTPDYFWVGATFAWDFPNEDPTEEKRAVLEAGLQQLLKVPYRIVGQEAGVRPSGTDRRPMLGLHPKHPGLGIFNGLGTKGTSLAPAMAAHFADHLLQNLPLWPEVDIKRFFNRYKE
jgi:glycine/D-amino acid oxidase-like deaminating enzyme